MSRVRVLQGADYKKVKMEKFVLYFKGVKSEWGKITWPDRKQVIAQTLIVLAVVTAFTIYTYGIDIIFQMIIKMLNLKA